MCDSTIPEVIPCPPPTPTHTPPPQSASKSRTHKVRKSGPATETAKSRARSQSLSRRKSRKQALIQAYRHPKVREETPSKAGSCGRVLRADSSSPSVRRGRGYFRGVGDSFSTCRNRRDGKLGVRNVGDGMVALGRALSPSPERV